MQTVTTVFPEFGEVVVAKNFVWDYYPGNGSSIFIMLFNRDHGQSGLTGWLVLCQGNVGYLLIILELQTVTVFQLLAKFRALLWQ